MLLEGLLREAQQSAARLESDRNRAEGERAAAELRFLDRISGLETLLRESEQQRAALLERRSQQSRRRARRSRAAFP